MPLLLLPVIIKGLAILAVVGGLWAGFLYWRHSVWVEGRDAALEAVAKQNEVARQAAQGTKSEIDRCFDSGGDWSVSTGKCEGAEEKRF